MPIYKCPKCGRTVERPEGTYYCRVCGPEVLMILVSGEGGAERGQKGVDVLYLLELAEKILTDLVDIAEFADWESWGAAEYRVGDVRYELGRLEKAIGEQPELRWILERLEEGVKKKSYTDVKVRAFRVFQPALFRALRKALQ